MIRMVFENINKKVFIFLILISILNILVALPFPILQQRIIDSITNDKWISVKMCLIVLVIIAAIQLIISIVNSILFSNLKEKNLYMFRKRILNKVLKSKMEIIKDIDTNYLLNSIYTDTVVVQNYVFDNLFIIIKNIFTISFSIIYIWMIDIRILILIFIILIINGICYKIFKKKIFDFNYKYKEFQNKLYSRYNESFNNLETIKINSLEEFELKKNDGIFSDNFKIYKKLTKINSIYNTILASSEIIMIIVILLIGAISIHSGRMSIGELVSIMFLSQYLIKPVYALFDMIYNYQQIRASITRLEKIMKLPEEISGNIEIMSIDEIIVKIKEFKYSDKVLIKDKNFEFKKGNIYVINGRNGVGKSTVAKLICKLYSEYKGDIFINGKDINHLENINYKKRISFVEQFPKIFNGSVLENIFYNQGEYNIENIKGHRNYYYIQKLLDSFIGLDINDTKMLNTQNLINISGGELQKISFIKSMIKDGELFILDEPSNSIDKSSLDDIIDILDEVKKDKIIIIFTHLDRFYDIADKIINM